MESWKRAKAPGSNVTHCLADGCSADLSLCRDYHRRHKVCEIHSKTPKVTIGGREQRFCQQCSRFHSLVEFDEGKRSCRKRLDGHNRRRRKPPPPQPDRLVFSTQPPLPPTGRLLSFGSSPHEILATSSILTSSWTGAIKSEEAVYNNHHQPINYNSSSSSFPEQSINQLHFQFINTNNDDYMDGRKMFAADGLVDSSDRALSLLSPPAPHPVHNYFQSCHQYQLEDDQESSKANLVDDVSSVPRMMFQSSDQGPSSTAGPHHQTLTFMWE